MRPAHADRIPGDDGQSRIRAHASSGRCERDRGESGADDSDSTHGDPIVAPAPAQIAKPRRQRLMIRHWTSTISAVSPNMTSVAAAA